MIYTACESAAAGFRSASLLSPVLRAPAGGREEQRNISREEVQHLQRTRWTRPMHTSSFDKMRAFCAKYLSERRDRPLLIVNIGSQDINGSYKPLFDAPCCGTTWVSTRRKRATSTSCSRTRTAGVRTSRTPSTSGSLARPSSTSNTRGSRCSRSSAS